MSNIRDGRENLSRNMARRKAKHKAWLEEHPEVADFMDAIEEGHELEENETDQDQNEE